MLAWRGRKDMQWQAACEKLCLPWLRTDNRYVSSPQGSPREPRGVTHSLISPGSLTSGQSHFLHPQMFCLYSCGIQSFPNACLSSAASPYFHQHHDGINHLNWSLDFTDPCWQRCQDSGSQIRWSHGLPVLHFMSESPSVLQRPGGTYRKKKSMLGFSLLSF